MTANKTLLQRKNARIILLLAERKGIATREALDLFYRSATYLEIRNGVSDMHCRSDKYLADEIFMEEEQTLYNT